MSTHPARRTLICFCTTFLGGTGIPDIRNSWSILYETKILFWGWVYWVYVAVLVARCLLLRCHWFLLCFALWCFVYSMSVSVSFFCGVLYVIFSCACGVGCGTSRSVLAPFLHATSLFSDPSSYRTWTPYTSYPTFVLPPKQCSYPSKNCPLFCSSKRYPFSILKSYPFSRACYHYIVLFAVVGVDLCTVFNFVGGVCPSWFVCSASVYMNCSTEGCGISVRVDCCTVVGISGEVCWHNLSVYVDCRTVVGV